MKTLYIVRHAKAYDAKQGESDVARCLDQTGYHEALLLGSYLKTLPVLPDGALCSNALRAKQTFDLVQELCPLPIPCRYSSLLNVSCQTLLEDIRKTEEQTRALLLVAHNPALEQLVSFLSKGGNVILPTASLALFSVAAKTWDKLSPECCQYHMVWHPAGKN